MNMAEINTVDKLLAIEKLYLSITVDSDTAVIIDTGSFESVVPQEYLTVLGKNPADGNYGINIFAVNVSRSDNVWSVNVATDEAEKGTLYVNGSKISESSYVTDEGETLYKFEYEGGKVYHVHTVITFTEARYAMTSLLFEF